MQKEAKRRYSPATMTSVEKIRDFLWSTEGIVVMSETC